MADNIYGYSGRFQKGQKGGPGRPKGSRAKLGEQYFLDMYEAWKIEGKAVIYRVIEERPHEFLRAVGNIIPAEVNLNLANQLQELTDAELDLLERFAEQQQALQIEHEPQEEEEPAK